jgi:lipopolysaccharide biosynthesis protein
MDCVSESSTPRTARSAPPEVVAAAVRVIAFYLPQFHPIPENDAWWGKGFTEWTNVAKAKPLFSGHRQPRLPADLGYYDLRVPEVREAQAALARQAGVAGFAYWHYWFGGGRRIIERPFEEVRDSGRPDFPFCLAWANQSWTGIWHGNPKSVLMKQEYPGPADDEAHFRWAQKAFEDPRYLTVDGKPMFIVFAPHDHPSIAQFIEHWRELAARAGYPGLYFVAISNRYADGIDPYRNPILDPFDAITPLVPQDFLETVARQTRFRDVRRRLKELNMGGRLNELKSERWKRPTRIRYADVVAHALSDMPPGPRYLPCVLPGWDNTPRSGSRGVVYEGETPELFHAYLSKAAHRVAAYPEQQRVVFVKAWNEWAEGNYLEPDSVSGHAYLDVVRSVILRNER